MRTEYENLVAGALLHDIGKIVQRAADNSNKTNHTNFGLDFIKPYSNNAIDDCILYHHSGKMEHCKLDSDNIAYIVYEADNIASSVDRRKDEDENKSLGFDTNSSLKSVFNLLNVDISKTDTNYKMFNLEEEELFYPTEKTILYTKQDYKAIKSKIEWYFKDLDNPLNINNLMKMNDLYTRYIPSSTDKSQVADISLYNHSKLTAAIAGCMYYYYEDNFKSDMLTNTANARKEEAYLLVSADISGIQDFIYTITNEKVMKSLRGRSLYLEMLSENIIDEILTELNLCRANLIYNGGGHFYMLLPNTIEANDVLAKIENRCNDFFIENFVGQLSISISSVKCSSNNLKSLEVNSLFSEVNKQNNLKKYNKWNKNQIMQLVIPEKLQNERECKICGLEHKNLHDDICENCSSFIELGGAILKYNPNADYMVVTNKKINNTSIKLPSINGEVYLSFTDDKMQEIERCYTFNKTYYDNCDLGVTHLVSANYTKIYNDEYYTLEDYKEASIGIKKIGALRLDIDNLGKVFINGLINNSIKETTKYVTISRLADISDKLSFFFKYEINKICKNKNITIIYSGGDDVFVIGSWNDVLIFAVEFKNSFNEYFNNKLTFSAGFSMYNSKTPISLIAEDLERLQDFAKSIDDSKDKICLFEPSKDNTFTWEDFIVNVMGDNCKKIDDWFDFKANKDGINTNKMDFGMSKAYYLINHIREIKSQSRINIARLMYFIARIKPVVNKKSEKLKENYQDFRKYMYTIAQKQDYKRLNEFEMALTLKIYEYRED